MSDKMREFVDHVAAFVDELPDREYKGLGRLRGMLRELTAQPDSPAPADAVACERCGKEVPTVGVPVPPDTAERLCGQCVSEMLGESFMLMEKARETFATMQRKADADAVAAERERWWKRWSTYAPCVKRNIEQTRKW